MSASPDDDAPEALADAAPGTRHTPPVVRLLLIDDAPSLLDALTLAFEDAGYEVLVARDGVSGLELVSRVEARPRRERHRPRPRGGLT